MNLTALSGSQWPNGVALLYVAVLTALTFRLPKRYKWAALTLALVLGAIVVEKNVVYAVIVSGPHAENSMNAHYDYASALLGVGISELGVATCLVALTAWIGFTSRRLPGWRPVKSLSLTSLTGAAACAAVYAGLCMLGWQRVYDDSAAGATVRYSVSDAPYHWAALASMVVLTVLALCAFLWKPRPARQP